ncbi:MAG: peptide chain release factor 2 [Bacilli bacterium]|nr:peptide chain release factor 2 [Bacilli bacterium]
MKELVELRNDFAHLSELTDQLGGSLDLAKIQAVIKQNEALMNEPNFWDEQKKAVKIVNELNDNKEILESFTAIKKAHQDLKDLLNNLSDTDQEMLTFANDLYRDLNEQVASLRIKVLFTGPFDHLNAIMDIHPGAGGTEAMDWANMLYRMYTRYAEKHHFKVQIIDFQYGEEAGLKSATIKISGPHAYGLMRSEKGVHRLVRISPFDANSRRHTSFASVNVIPEFDDDINVEINDKDLRIDTYRSGGAGGQNVNKVSSAVRITHLPTGIVVSSQVERSQLMNKETCMRMLKGILYQREVEKKQKELDAIVGVKNNIEWGSQIRSYVFCPYTLVKDNRTECENVDVNAVMDGDLDDFIYAYLEKEAKRHGIK